MRQLNIKFINAEQVIQFVNIVSKIDLELKLGTEQKKVNAKSILGIFTLDLSLPQILQYDSGDSEIDIQLRQFVI